MIAYYAPPALGIAVNRLMGFLRHLPDLGWDPVLIAPADVYHHRTAGDQEALAGVRVVRVPNPEPSRWIRRRLGRGEEEGNEEGGRGGAREVRPLEVGPLGAWARRLANEWLYVPDAQFPWIRPAAKAAAHALRASPAGVRVLFSTSVPYSCHFAARRAAAATGAPWVAEYRDPWSVAPPQFGTRSSLRRAMDRRLDHGVATRCGRLVVTSNRTRELFLEAFPEIGDRVIRVVRNGWEDDAEGEPARPPGPDERLRLVYAGSLLRGAWASPFLDGLAAVDAAAPGRVGLDVYGPEEPWRSLIGAGSRAAPPVTLHGIVPASAVAAELARASALVLLQPDAVNYVPGKTYDYLGARRPVLADVPRDSETHGLLSSHGEVHSLDGLDRDGVASLLRALLDRHGAGELSAPTVEAGRVTALSRRAQAALLAAVFDEVSGR